MQKRLLFLILFFIAGKTFSQDIDFYHIMKNDNFKYPAISWQMSSDEFELLSRHLRMKDMMYAMIVPGYVHFYEKDYKTGYIILATRMVGFGLMTVANIGLKEYSGWFLNKQERQRKEFYAGLFNLSMGIIFGTYFYDWIHGEYRLKEKQELIRYKYSMKLRLMAQPELIRIKNRAVPSVGVKLNF
jgi:hypothetical protein